MTETLEKLSIPPYKAPLVNGLSASPVQSNHTSHSLDANSTHTNSQSHASSVPRHMESTDVVDAVMNSPPVIQYEYKATIPPHLEPESNSEDSSLSDTGTLVGDVSPMLSTSNSPAYSDQQLSSPEDHSKMNGDYYDDDDTVMLDLGKAKNQYFRAIYYEEPITGDREEPTRMLKVMVHRNTTIANLKRALEPYIKVEMQYFKIFRIVSTLTEIECTYLSDDLTSFK